MISKQPDGTFRLLGKDASRFQRMQSLAARVVSHYTKRISVCMYFQDEKLPFVQFAYYVPQSDTIFMNYSTLGSRTDLIVVMKHEIAHALSPQYYGHNLQWVKKFRALLEDGKFAVLDQDYIEWLLEVDFGNGQFD